MTSISFKDNISTPWHLQESSSASSEQEECFLSDDEQDQEILLIDTFWEALIDPKSSGRMVELLDEGVDEKAPIAEFKRNIEQWREALEHLKRELSVDDTETFDAIVTHFQDPSLSQRLQDGSAGFVKFHSALLAALVSFPILLAQVDGDRDRIPEMCIEPLRKLKTLDFTHKDKDVALPALHWIPQLPALETLHLQMTAYERKSLSSISECPTLRNLVISEAVKTEREIQERKSTVCLILSGLASCKNLESLTFYNVAKKVSTKVIDQILPYFEKLSRLHFEGPCPKNISEIMKLSDRIQISADQYDRSLFNVNDATLNLAHEFKNIHLTKGLE